MQEHNISVNNLEECQKCAICTTVCPILANNEEYAGPKQSGPDGERYRLKNSLFYDENLKYCLNCKRCEVACPPGVRIGDIIQSARIRYGRKQPRLRDRILAGTDVMGPLASAIAPVVNWSLGLKPVKLAMDTVLGIDKHRDFPKYASQTFESWFKKNAEASQEAFAKHISYFHGCYANYNFPQLGKDFVKLMNALGYGVHLLDKEECCGVALITNGMISQAEAKAEHNIGEFRKSAALGRPVVTVSTTCTMTIREEYPHLLGIDNSSVKDNVILVEKFLYKLISEGSVKLVFKDGYKARAAYHAPCHQERLGWSIFTTELLRMIPGLELTELDSNCCGIGGTYGFKKENYKVSQAAGKALFDNIRDVDPDFIACECETCKWQIEMSTGYSVKNPVSILAEALDIEATAKLNR